MNTEDFFAGEVGCYKISLPASPWMRFFRWRLATAKRAKDGNEITRILHAKRYLGNMEEEGVGGSWGVLPQDYTHLEEVLSKYLGEKNLTLRNLEIKNGRQAPYQDAHGNHFETFEVHVTV